MVPDAVGGLLLGEKRKRPAAVSVQEKDLIGIRVKAGIQASNIVNDHQVQVLGLQFTLPFLLEVFTFRGKADQNLALFPGTAQLLQDILIRDQFQGRPGLAFLDLIWFTVRRTEIGNSGSTMPKPIISTSAMPMSTITDGRSISDLSLTASQFSAGLSPLESRTCGSPGTTAHPGE